MDDRSTGFIHSPNATSQGSQKEVQKLYRFFAKHAQVSQRKLDIFPAEEVEGIKKETVKNIAKTNKLTVAEEKELLDRVMRDEGTFEDFKKRKRIDWWESEHFQAFIKDYQKIAQIVDSICNEGGYNRTDLDWIKSLGKQMRSMIRISDSQGGPFSGVWIDLNQHTCYEFRTMRDGKWHEISIDGIGAAVYYGFISLFKGEAKIRRCEVADCGKVFEPYDRGRIQRFCSDSCRVRAHNIRIGKLRYNPGLGRNFA